MSRLFSLFWSYNLPRWLILIIDLVICAFSLTLAFFLRFDFSRIPAVDLKNLPYDYALLLFVRALTFFVSKTYKGVVRYTGSRDSMRILGVVMLGSAILVAINFITLLAFGYFIMPTAVIIIDALVTLFIMISSRLAVKALYLETKNPEKGKINVLIYGAGEAGIITKRTLDRDAAIKYKVVGFIDDDPKKTGRSLEGIFVYTPERTEELVRENAVEYMIISIQNLPPAKKNEITDLCLNNNV
ncbi:MAG: nucleoside-diphosphate sugar epimerase/dehydratase, partial [Bacteroidia bacterium]